MTTFQWLAGSLMGMLAILEIYLQLARKARRRVGGLRLCVWLSALFLIVNPSATQALANFLSIGRGADVLLYCMVIAFLLSFFYVIHALERQREQLTYLVRQIALSQPFHTPEKPTTRQEEMETKPIHE